MAHLWEKLPEHLRHLFIGCLGSEEAARGLLMFLAGVHDVGKASSFQLKSLSGFGEIPLPDFRTLLSRVGISFGMSMNPNVRHGAVGQIALTGWLKERHGWSPRRTARLAGIIGGHHGSNPTATELQELKRDQRRWDSPSLNSVRQEIFQRMSEFAGVDSSLSKWASNPLPMSLQVLAEALVIEADWIASNTDLFPLTLSSGGEARAEIGWSRLGLPEPWKPVLTSGSAQDLFSTRFPQLAASQPNEVQEEMVEIARSMPEPGLILLEAPMGSGKTEAALLAAEILATRFGCEGVFIALPTMATANPMFTRTRLWLESVPTANYSSINLAHSKAALNPDFRAVMSVADSLGPMGDDPFSAKQRVIVHQWTMGRKKSLLAKHVVGTIDQLLFAALKAKHVVLRHLGLAGKVVIIDECHAADHFMRVYLKRVLNWLGAYGTPVILMSATLPPAQRQELVDAYRLGRERDGEGPGTRPDAYPRITVAAETVGEIVPEWSAGENCVELQLLEDGSLIDTLSEVLGDGGCAAVIRNTVASAQQTYLALRSALPDTEIRLLHSRFLAPHRMSREADLVSRLGRSGDRPHRLIVVGTQVLEQSLDVDFDVMFSDIAPTDLLMQRVGRLHRHSRSNRPSRLSGARCFILGVDSTAAPPGFDRGSQAIYGNASLLRSVATIFKDRDSPVTLRLPQDIPRLVREAYSQDIRLPESWREVFESTSAREMADREQSLARAIAFVIEDPYKPSDLNGFIAGEASDPEDTTGYGRVRDSEDSLEVIVLVRQSNGMIRIPEGVPEFGGRIVPSVLGNGPGDNELAMAMASCTVPLPQSLSGAWIIDNMIAELENQHDVSGWQESPWLRGQLCLFLDEDGVAPLTVSAVSYGSDIGLVVESQTQ